MRGDKGRYAGGVVISKDVQERVFLKPGFGMSRLWVLVAVFVLLLVLAGGLYWAVREAGEQVRRGQAELVKAAGEEVRRVFREVMNVAPRVEVAGEVLYEQSAPIHEVAVLVRDFSYTYFWKHTWMGSSKEIEVGASFRAKAGISLVGAPVVVRMDVEGNPVEVLLPEVELLSLEQVGGVRYRDEEGLWNSLSDGDRAAALTALQKEARRKVGASDLLVEARGEIRRRIREGLSAPGLRFDFQHKTSVEEK